MKRIIAVLDTFVAVPSQRLLHAPRYFIINPRNFTGKRLYQLVGPGNRILVTDACKDVVYSAKLHSTPDPIWLFQNLCQLEFARPDLILVCGKVAQQTYLESKYRPGFNMRVLEIPHPAARVIWTPEFVKEIQEKIQGAL